MNKRFDLMTPRPKKDSDKPYWHKVGAAFEGDRGITLYFDSLPLPDREGRTVVKLFEPRQQNTAQRADDGYRQHQGGFDDSVGF